MIALWKGKNPIYFGVKGQGHCYYKYNFWQQDRFRTITLVLYIGSLANLATWFPCGRGRTLFILGSLLLYRLIIYIDRRILWCTHFLFNFKIQWIGNCFQLFCSLTQSYYINCGCYMGRKQIWDITKWQGLPGKLQKDAPINRK